MAGKCLLVVFGLLSLIFNKKYFCNFQQYFFIKCVQFHPCLQRTTQPNALIQFIWLHFRDKFDSESPWFDCMGDYAYINEFIIIIIIIHFIWKYENEQKKSLKKFPFSVHVHHDKLNINETLHFKGILHLYKI